MMVRLAFSADDYEMLHLAIINSATRPHASQTIRNAIWHGAVIAVPQVQLRQPHACQHHDGVFAKAHIPPPHSLRLKPAKKADVIILPPSLLAHCLAAFRLTTFPVAYATWEPPHAVSFAVPPRTGTPFAASLARHWGTPPVLRVN